MFNHKVTLSSRSGHKGLFRKTGLVWIQEIIEVDSEVDEEKRLRKYPVNFLPF